MLKDRPQPLDRETAEGIAVRALGYLAEDARLLDRFLRLTGLTPGSLRAAARDPAFLAGVMDFLIGDETALVAFAASAELPPEKVVAAHHLLAGGPPEAA